MKKLFRLAALAAVTLPLLVACKPNDGNQPTNNELDGPYVDFAEIVNGKLVLDNEKFTNGAFSFDITYSSNGEVYYNGEESHILTIGDPKVTGEGAKKGYAFPVTVNPPLDSEDAEFTLVFAVKYDANTTESEANKLTIIRKGLQNVSTPKGALTGKFSLGGGGQVYFAKGNLEYDSLLNQYSFAESQYKEEEGRLGLDRYVSLFPQTAYSFSSWPIFDAEPSDDDNYWFIPTTEQWNYLIYKRANADKLRVWYQINDELNPGSQHGLVLLPDNYLDLAAEKGWDVSNLGQYFTITTEEELKLLDSRGALILMPMGSLVSSDIYSDIPLEEARAMYGVYWSSSQQSEDEGKMSTIALVLNDVKSEDNGLNLIRVHQDEHSARMGCIRLAYIKFK
ncbi:MAG: hypothetical protein K5660_07485 [Paludibacteraceae bacterium]|nr:hypothetical protein [Paludibacteraceae bacterium]